MKIDSSLKPVAGPTAGQPKGRAEAGGNAAAGETVELSSLSTTLQKAETAIASAPEVDSKRVEEIRQAISEGRFKVDPGRIADGLLDSVRQLLAGQPEQP
ncbi:flagellar biosynthesis anti-sigma factor FlgM [Pseudothauera rhizosphaerae]|uniref:Negative regulator of flagellin synthesis n=1 Tax=Pseudothauera rhizosphaerae TaxID=2565932 RepID=A0A4S4AWC5_9RHOO|nr:flagellar biosynthesis anti-sigma factor FlgM [Pseudothauera rhizosphaerae]THF64187.1 flagellar biosynthesis anti-sigma factor FlgM [Pseudothauera rhizosphaerae]